MITDEDINEIIDTLKDIAIYTERIAKELERLNDKEFIKVVHISAKEL